MQKTRIYKVTLADKIHFVRAGTPSQATTCVVKSMVTASVATQDDLVNNRDVPVIDAKEGPAQLDIEEAGRDQ